MKLKTLSLTLLTLISAVAMGNDISSTCTNFVEKVRNDNSRSYTIQAVYECGPNFTVQGGKAPAPVNGCLVYFETKIGRTPVSISAFQDVANNHTIDWMIQGSGWSKSGKYFCADIKTYANATNHGDTATVQIKRSTARGSLFCPIARRFTDYTTTCHRVM